MFLFDSSRDDSAAAEGSRTLSLDFCQAVLRKWLNVLRFLISISATLKTFKILDDQKMKFHLFRTCIFLFHFAFVLSAPSDDRIYGDDHTLNPLAWTKCQYKKVSIINCLRGDKFAAKIWTVSGGYVDSI